MTNTAYQGWTARKVKSCRKCFASFIPTGSRALDCPTCTACKKCGEPRRAGVTHTCRKTA